MDQNRNAIKPLDNQLILRPRFQREWEGDKSSLLARFTDVKHPTLLVKCTGEHVYLKFKKEHQTFWSPQLHLEILDDLGPTEIHGRFGPNPSLWTLFMFLHFMIGSLFIVCGVWAYVNHNLGKPFNLQLILMGLMVLFWIGFYIFGRFGKEIGRPQMHELYDFAMETIKS